MHRKLLLVLAAAVTLAATGCGGSDSLTKGQLARRAAAICVRVNAQTLELMRTVGSSGKAGAQNEAIASVIPKVAARQRQTLQALDGLQPPEQLQGEYDRFKAAMLATAELLPAPADVRAGRDPKLEERQAQLTKAERLARDLGIQHCPR